MLNWIEENGKHLGFEDGALAYRVAKDENGWYYEYVPDADGMDGYETAEEAMAAADEEHNISESMWADQMEDLEPLDLEDLEDAYWDMVAHERMEARMGW